MRRSLFYVLSLSVFISSVNTASSSTAITETLEDITGAIRQISPVYQPKDTDGLSLVEIAGSTGTELDNATSTNATSIATSYKLWTVDSSNQLIALISTGGAWRTLQSSALAASWNATGTVVLTESVRDGAASPASPYTLTITLTKAATGTPADLERDRLISFLEGSRTSILNLATAGGTTLVGTPALTPGWTARALLADGASATVTPATLDPIALTMNVSVTPQEGSNIPFSATVSDLHEWNILTSSTTVTEEVLLTAIGSRYIKFNAYPAVFARTTSIGNALLDAFNAMPKRFNQSGASYLNTLPDSLSGVLALLDSTPPVNLKAGFNGMAKDAVEAAGFVIGDFTTTADTDKLGVVALASADITAVTWTTEGSILKAIGTIGTGRAKEFTCDLNNIEVVDSTTNSVLEFTSKDGDAFWVKCVDATGYDTSADTSVAPADRDSLLALQLAGILSSVTTITSSNLKALLTASA